MRLEAAGLNQLDEKIRDGEFKQILPYTLPQTLGHDVAGTVVRRRRESSPVQRRRPGLRPAGNGPDRHLRRTRRRGRGRSRIATHHHHRRRSPIATARRADRLAGPRREGRAARRTESLIHTGAGGVGTIAIQLAKHLGATVATTTSGSTPSSSASSSAGESC
ncbi:alcohol dehydrogenase catalytic domain-containing protein [Rhodococcus globerulus]|uniref:alcohol dehydrogenase catalytic domain-containing protein n=1 Tax=Rhodococcus globerulus TaxID=33008 RepID=UPI003AFB5BCA